MKYLQLFQDGKEMLASDGVMRVDGRVNLLNIKMAVRSRNESFKKNFPYKIADGFKVYSNGIGSPLSALIHL